MQIHRNFIYFPTLLPIYCIYLSCSKGYFIIVKLLSPLLLLVLLLIVPIQYILPTILAGSSTRLLYALIFVLDFVVYCVLLGIIHQFIVVNVISRDLLRNAFATFFVIGWK